MNLNLLKYFLVIANTGSITKASEILLVTQPSLTVSVQKLEEHLGIKLFERRKKKLVLTCAGKYFQSKAEKILKEIEFIKKEINENFSHQKLIRIGCFHAITSLDIIRLITNFCQLYPDIVIEQRYGNIMDLENWLENNEIDLAITVLKNQNEKSKSQVLFQESYSLALVEDHPLTRSKSISVSELDGLPYIDRIRCDKRDEVQKLFLEKGIHPKITYQVADNELANALIYAGIGVAIIPDCSMPGIVHLPFLDFNLIRQIGLVWNSENNSKAVEMFRQLSTLYCTKKSTSVYPVTPRLAAFK